MTFEHDLTESDVDDSAALHVRGQLSFEDRKGIEAALQALFDTGRTSLTVDLTNTQRVTSVFFGALLQLAASAEKEKHAVRAIIPPHLLQICKEAGIDRVVQILTPE